MRQWYGENMNEQKTEQALEMTLEQAMQWAGKNCQPEAVERLRSRAVVATLIGEVERLRQVARNVYEVWAGSDGIPMPETAAEGYLLHLVEQMRDEAKNGLHNDKLEI
jgi:hypothetical protein